MGYDVHITRASHWTNSQSNPITIQEWLAYIESDPEMRMDGFAEVRTPAGEIIRYENAGLAVWTAWSSGGEDGNRAWFDYRNGVIVVKNPDETIVSKMCAIAEKIGARVQGDDGENYPERPVSSSDEQGKESTQHSRTPWWRRIFGG